MTSMKIRFTLHGADAELMRALQNWLRQNSEEGQPGHGLPQDPDEIAKRSVINFLYQAVQTTPVEEGSQDNARPETDEGNPLTGADGSADARS